MSTFMTLLGQTELVQLDVLIMNSKKVCLDTNLSQKYHVKDWWYSARLCKIQSNSSKS